MPREVGILQTSGKLRVSSDYSKISAKEPCPEGSSLQWLGSAVFRRCTQCSVAKTATCSSDKVGADFSAFVMAMDAGNALTLKLFEAPINMEGKRVRMQ